jgi:hypothetical protein
MNGNQCLTRLTPTSRGKTMKSEDISHLLTREHTHEIIYLAQDQTISIQKTLKQGERIKCLSGLLWITAENFKGDIFLNENKDVEMHGAKHIVITALKSSSFTYEQAMA